MIWTRPSAEKNRTETGTAIILCNISKRLRTHC